MKSYRKFKILKFLKNISIFIILSFCPFMLAYYSYVEEGNPLF